MAKDSKQLRVAGAVAWLRADETWPELRCCLPPEPGAAREALGFFVDMQEALRRHGRASRRWIALSEPEALRRLGPRPRRHPLVKEIQLRAEQARDTTEWSMERGEAKVQLDASGLTQLVEALRLQAEPSSPSFHGSSTEWGFAFALDWDAAE